MALQTSRKSSFWQSFISDFHISPEYCGLVNDVTHIPASASHGPLSRVHYYDSLSQSEPMSGLWRTKGRAHPCHYCYSVSQRAQCRSSKFRKPLPLLPKLSLITAIETSMETTNWNQLNTCSENQVWHSDTFHMLSLSVSPATTLKFFFFSFLNMLWKDITMVGHWSNIFSMHLWVMNSWNVSPAAESEYSLFQLLCDRRKWRLWWPCTDISICRRRLSLRQRQVTTRWAMAMIKLIVA